VIFVARHSLSSIQKILECLLAQTAAHRIEFLLSCDSPELLRQAGDFLEARSCFARCRFLLHQTQNLAEARALSVVEATGDAVAFTEDHCFPEPNWAEELLTAFESSLHIHAAAPVMINPNPDSAVSRVQFLLFFGRHRKDSSSRSRFENADRLPTHNTAYRREALVEVLHEVSFLAEGFLQEKIRADRPLRALHTDDLGTCQHEQALPGRSAGFLGRKDFWRRAGQTNGMAVGVEGGAFLAVPVCPPDCDSTIRFTPLRQGFLGENCFKLLDSLDSATGPCFRRVDRHLLWLGASR
jgi:hypothetical protein